MGPRDRVLLVLAAPVVTVGLIMVAWLALPGVRQCPSISCGTNFDPGGTRVFGDEVFTPAQSFVMAFAIWAGAFLLGRGVLPARRLWTSATFGLAVFAFV